MTTLFRILTLTALLFATPALAAQTPIGVWSMGKVTVKVVNCGGGICANIVALKEPISKIDGKPKVDRENPNPALRSRPLIGLAVISGMRPAGEGKWQGTIYNADDGKTYAATLRLEGDSMKVEGCVLGFLCRTNNFVRVN